jgi:aquaporin Z
MFCGVGSIIINAQTKNSIGNVGISLTFGAVISIMIYTCGHASGAQFNPAVTIALSVFNKMDRKMAIPYIISQVLGAIAGSAVLKIIFGQQAQLGDTVPKITVNGSLITDSFVLEFIFTFLLMTVILNVAVRKSADNKFAGFIIGIVIFIGALIAGPISGGSFNPARSLGPAIVNSDYRHLWIYILSPIIAAVFAGLLFEITSEKKVRSLDDELADVDIPVHYKKEVV